MKKPASLSFAFIVAFALAAGFSSPGHAMPDWNPDWGDTQLTKKFDQTGGGWTTPPVGVCWESACVHASSCCAVVAK